MAKSTSWIVHSTYSGFKEINFLSWFMNEYEYDCNMFITVDVIDEVGHSVTRVLKNRYSLFSVSLSEYL